MNLEQAIQTINATLLIEDPKTFSGTWIYRRTPKAYRYVWANVKTDLGDIDWDRVVCSLDRPFQKRWRHRRPKRIRPYRNVREVRIVLKPYQRKLYVFLSPMDEADKLLRDTISVALVRVAQKGNVRAQQELVKLLRYMVDQWIEQSPRLWKWRGYTDDIDDKLKDCIRCYRFTGTFIGYLFKTLEYSGDGLRPLHAYSLNEAFRDVERERIENVVQDPETGEIKMYDSTR